MATFTWTSESAVQVAADSSVHPITAEIRGLRGQATCEVVDGALAPGLGTTGWIEGDVSQLETGKRLEDMALRKQIDAKRHPTVRYEVRSLEGADGNFKVNGVFTFHGETRELTETCNARLDGGRLLVDAEHTVDIRDFGVKPFKVLTLSIQPEVRLSLHLIGAESGGSAPAWG
ncbi:MAG TPA: YceI family protein [Acidimicrobiales bacterium]|nr:YceI family protein [Acidimicrobiales bacterium]